MMVVYTGVRDSYERTRNEIAEQRSVPFMKRCKDGWIWVGVCNVGQQGRRRERPYEWPGGRRLVIGEVG